MSTYATLRSSWWLLNGGQIRLDRLAEDVDDLRASTADLRTTAEIMLQPLTQHQQNFEVVVNEIQVIKADIKGLQLENRRMLEELNHFSS